MKELKNAIFITAFVCFAFSSLEVKAFFWQESDQFEENEMPEWILFPESDTDESIFAIGYGGKFKHALIIAFSNLALKANNVAYDDYDSGKGTLVSTSNVEKRIGDFQITVEISLETDTLDYISEFFYQKMTVKLIPKKKVTYEMSMMLEETVMEEGTKNFAEFMEDDTVLDFSGMLNFIKNESDYLEISKREKKNGEHYVQLKLDRSYLAN